MVQNWSPVGRHSLANWHSSMRFCVIGVNNQIIKLLRKANKDVNATLCPYMDPIIATCLLEKKTRCGLEYTSRCKSYSFWSNACCDLCCLCGNAQEVVSGSFASKNLFRAVFLRQLSFIINYCQQNGRCKYIKTAHVVLCSCKLVYCLCISELTRTIYKPFLHIITDIKPQ